MASNRSSARPARSARAERRAAQKAARAANQTEPKDETTVTDDDQDNVDVVEDMTSSDDPAETEPELVEETSEADLEAASEPDEAEPDKPTLHDPQAPEPTSEASDDLVVDFTQLVGDPIIASPQPNLTTSVMPPATTPAAPTRQRRAGKAQQDKEPGTNYKMPREGTERHMVLKLMDGTRTPEEIAVIMKKKNARFDTKYVYAHAYCTFRDCGIGYHTAVDGKLEARFPPPKVPR